MILVWSQDDDEDMCFETFQIRILLTQEYQSGIDDIICEFLPCLQDFTIPLIKKKVLYPPVNI